ncbi:MAG TPA: hypothetical protein VM115_07555 [Vicinamibacterales bacterium]|nr:hypothetical protein [Vicinamibacterales bacterium]
MRMSTIAACFLFVLIPALAGAQTESPLTAVDLEKSKLRVLDEKKPTQLPPAARKALSMPEARADFKPIVAGDAKTQGVADDIFRM